MERFRIYSPILGVKQDVPAILLAEAFTADNSNVEFKGGEVRRVAGPTAGFTAAGANQAMPDGLRIMRFCWYVMDSGTAHLLALTPQHIYRWSYSTNAWAALYTVPGGATATRWQTAVIGDRVYAANDQDGVQYWDGSAGAFAIVNGASGIDLGGGVYVSRARVMTAWDNRLWIGDYTAAGTRYPFGVRWSKLGVPEDFTGATDAGTTSLPDPDRVTAFGPLQGQLVVFKERSIHRLWPVSGSLIYAQELLNSAMGTYSLDSVIVDGRGRLAWLGSDKKIRVLAGLEPVVVSDPVYEVCEAISDLQLANVRGLYSRKNDQMVWAVPSGDGQTLNNKLLILKEGVWSVRPVAASALGQTEDRDWETINDQDGTINSWAGTINGTDLTYNLFDIYGDYSGYGYRLDGDAAGSVTHYFALATDLGTGPIFYKRLLTMTVYFRAAAAGALTVQVRRDHEASYQTVPTGPVTLNPAGYAVGDIVSQRLACDYFAKHFYIKFSGTAAFRFVGVEFEFGPRGSR